MVKPAMMTHLAALRLLADGAIHSGATIAAHLGVSRTAVWKALDKLSAYGIEVIALRGQGYRLVEPLELLDAAQIRMALAPTIAPLIDEIEIHTSIGSTSSHLLRLAQAGARTGRVCLSEHQAHGRGRHGRGWVSPFGRGILLSILWRYDFGLAGLSGLSLAAGAVIADVLGEQGVADIGLKWPNDILWQRRKLAGLLLEAAGEAHGPSHVVIGVGINLKLPAAQAASIDQPWTDLATALATDHIARNHLAARLITALAGALDRYASDGLTPFLDHWEAHDHYRGETVIIHDGPRRFSGIHAGITPDGALRLLTETGERTFRAGEVSLRPAAP